MYIRIIKYLYMKKIIILLIAFVTINKTIDAQCGSFPLSISSPTISCAAPTGSIVVTTTVSPVSIVWTGPGILTGANTLSPSVNVGGIYAFTITNTSSGCIAIYNINVKSPVSITNPMLSCTTTTAPMNSTTSGFIPTSYFWQGPSILSSNTTNTITVNAPGIYICTVSNTLTGCQVSGSGSVSSDTFVPTITSTNNTLTCIAATANLMVSSPSFSPSLLNFLWQGGVISGATTQTATVASVGVYTCEITNTLNGCKTYTTATAFSNTTSPNASIMSSGSITCGSPTVTVSVSLTSSTSVTYSWSGPGIISSTTNSNIAVNSGGLYNCIITNTINGCSSTYSIGVMQNTTVPSIIATASSNSICVGSCVSLYAAGSGGTVPYTYSWTPSIGVFSTVNDCPSTSTTYTVNIIDANGCSSSASVNVIVDNTCQDVWPGDANSDAVADNLDVLELGLHYLQTGTARASVSNAWQSEFSTNWLGTISNGKNVNHSNCNGDGIINDDDTLAIYTNYSLTHVFKPEQVTTNPQLSIIPDQTLVAKGTWGTSSIYLGNATASITNLNGVAFTVNFDNALIDLNSVWLEYPTSFINASNHNLHFRKLDFTNSKLYTATTHTVNGNVSGNGKIAILHYKILSTLNTDNVLNLSLSQANQSNVSGAITPLTVGSGTLMAIGATVGLNNLLNNNNISIYPNPTNSSSVVDFTITGNETIKISVSDIVGRIVEESFTPTINNKTVNYTVNKNGSLAKGIYIVNIDVNNQRISKKLIIE